MAEEYQQSHTHIDTRETWYIVDHAAAKIEDRKYVEKIFWWSALERGESGRSVPPQQQEATQDEVDGASANDSSTSTSLAQPTRSILDFDFMNSCEITRTDSYVKRTCRTPYARSEDTLLLKAHLAEEKRGHRMSRTTNDCL